MTAIWIFREFTFLGVFWGLKTSSNNLKIVQIKYCAHTQTKAAALLHSYWRTSVTDGVNTCIQNDFCVFWVDWTVCLCLSLSSPTDILNFTNQSLQFNSFYAFLCLCQHTKSSRSSIFAELSYQSVIWNNLVIYSFFTQFFSSSVWNTRLNSAALSPIIHKFVFFVGENENLSPSHRYIYVTGKNETAKKFASHASMRIDKMGVWASNSAHAM